MSFPVAPMAVLESFLGILRILGIQFENHTVGVLFIGFINKESVTPNG